MPRKQGESKRNFKISADSKEARLLLKIIALILSVSLWIFVTWDDSEADRRTLSIPLKYEDLQEGYSVKNAVQAIDVFVEDRSSFGGRLGGEISVVASVSLSDLKPGKYTLPVIVEAPNGVSVIKYSPQTVNVELFRVITRTLRPTFAVSGDVSGDMSLGVAVINPQEVRVRGPEPSVISVQRAELRANVADAIKGIDGTLPVTLYSSDGAQIKDLIIEPSSLYVRVQLSKTLSEKRIPVSIQINGRPADGCEIGIVSISPDVVMARGEKALLDRLREITPDPIDISGQSESVSLSIELPPPSGLSIIDADSVNVNIEIIPSMKISTFSRVPVEVMGSGVYEDWMIEPPSVSVTVERSSESASADISEVPIRAVIDVTNIVSRQIMLPVMIQGLTNGMRLVNVEPAHIKAIAVR
jgi:YbbR domain-containing protein